MTPPVGPAMFAWRGTFTNRDVNHLHAEAFETRVFDDDEWNWLDLTERHSLGWVTARRQGILVGFVNVIWDGFVHAWLQDLMVARGSRRQKIGVGLVDAARAGAAAAGCEYLHVDFEEEMRSFYVDACGFEPTGGGIMLLNES